MLPSRRSFMSPRRPSPLHTKGFLTLSLLVFAESITLTNAVTFWSNLQEQNQPPPGGKPQPNFVSSLQKRFTGSLSGSNNNNAVDPSCANECAHCVRVDPTCRAAASMPRGGAAGEPLATAAAEGAAAAAATTPYNIPLHGWKVLFQAFLTTLNVVCWLLPLKSKKISENQLALSLANAFSGGVFLSLAFGHLIPECVEGFTELAEQSSSTSTSSFKWPHETPYLLVLTGYLIIFFVEKVAFDAHEIMHEMQEAGEKQMQQKQQQKQKQQQINGDTPRSISNISRASSSVSSSGRSAVILLGALAVHSVLEMMALGLADSFADCALLTLSISLHQPAESIALLVAFLKSGMSDGDIIRFLSIFSCMGPIGVALGMAVNEFAAPIVDSVMLAIVAGTFVYVGATEVIPEEWEDGQHKWVKFSALSAGIVSILVITQYTLSLSAAA